MRTSSLHFAQEILNHSGPRPDLILASDFVNLAELLAVLRTGGCDVPAVIYFHENQLTYPLQPGERVDYQFALTHFHAMLCARSVGFNSDYHRRSLLTALGQLIAKAPDVQLSGWVETLAPKSVVLPLGTCAPSQLPQSSHPTPTILWNHRWEYDKNPGRFLAALEELIAVRRDFRVRLLGERFRTVPVELSRLRILLGDQLIEDGFVEDHDQYLAEVAKCHIAVSTADHEFFGLGTLEAIRSGLLPVLPHDLAYPELLPDSPEVQALCLYGRDESLSTRLGRALDSVQSGGNRALRESLVSSTQRFHWPNLIDRYDDWLSDSAAGTPASVPRSSCL